MAAATVCQHGMFFHLSIPRLVCVVNTWHLLASLDSDIKMWLNLFREKLPFSFSSLHRYDECYLSPIDPERSSFCPSTQPLPTDSVACGYPLLMLDQAKVDFFSVHQQKLGNRTILIFPGLSFFLASEVQLWLDAVISNWYALPPVFSAHSINTSAIAAKFRTGPHRGDK